MKSKQVNYIYSDNFMSEDELVKLVDAEINKYLERACLKKQVLSKEILIKQNPWLGTLIPKCQRGFLGYLRLSFRRQIIILNNLSNHMPCNLDNIDHVKFILSPYFKEEVLKNGEIKPFFKKEHVEFYEKKGCK